MMDAPYFPASVFVVLCLCVAFFWPFFFLRLVKTRFFDSLCFVEVVLAFPLLAR